MQTLFTLAGAGLLCGGAAFSQDRSTVSVSPDSSAAPSVVAARAVNGGLTPGRSATGGTRSGPASGGGLLYDNGTADGVNGYSNATVGVLGARRTLLDDFTVPAATTWDLGCIAWTHLWNIELPGVGTGAEFEFRADAGGTPGAVFATAVVTGYTEVATGNCYFTRPEAASTATFDTITLGAGTYWFDGTVVGPDNNFWLTSGNGTLNGNECWVDYDDMGGLQPGSVIFGVVSDLNFQLFESFEPFVYYCNPSDGHPNNSAAISIDGNTLNGVDINVCMTGGPPGQWAYLLVGTTNGIVNQPPGAKGDLCIAGGIIGRYAMDLQALDGTGGMCVNLKANSTTATCPDYTIPNTGCGQQYQPGETWYFQFWHRQPMGMPSTFSEAVGVTFQ